MKNRDHLSFVIDMIEGIDKIFRYVETVGSIDDFLKNEMVIDAVTRNFEIIGEAAKNVSSEIKDKYPDVPWRQMYGLRNFAVHEYHIIDPVILWEIIQDHLLENKVQLEDLFESEK